jgi:hypothetical protein
MTAPQGFNTFADPWTVASQPGAMGQAGREVRTDLAKFVSLLFFNLSNSPSHPIPSHPISSHLAITTTITSSCTQSPILSADLVESPEDFHIHIDLPGVENLNVEVRSFCSLLHLFCCSFYVLPYSMSCSILCPAPFYVLLHSVSCSVLCPAPFYVLLHSMSCSVLCPAPFYVLLRSMLCSILCPAQFYSLLLYSILFHF